MRCGLLVSTLVAWCRLPPWKPLPLFLTQLRVPRNQSNYLPGANTMDFDLCAILIFSDWNLNRVGVGVLSGGGCGCASQTNRVTLSRGNYSRTANTPGGCSCREKQMNDSQFKKRPQFTQAGHWVCVNVRLGRRRWWRRWGRRGPLVKIMLVF